MTWIMCNNCGEPVGHFFDPWIKGRRKKKEYYKVKKWIKDSIICRKCLGV